MKNLLHHPYADFFSMDVVDELENMGITNLVGAVPLAPELDLTGNPIRAKSYWVWLRNPLDFPTNLSAEGKLYIPYRSRDTLIHYSPSGPVGNAGRFEKRYISDLVAAGYHVFTGRRNGASLLTEHAKEVANAPYRIELARRAGQTHVGGFRTEGYMPTDALDEPVASLMALGPMFEKICLLSQSFGASMHYHALNELEDYQGLTEKFGNVVNIAGYVGKLSQDANGLWNGTKVPGDQFAQIQVSEMRKADFNYNPAYGTSEYLNNMKQIALNNGMISVPPRIGHIFFNCPEDPFIAGPLSEDQATLAEYGPETPNKWFNSKHAPTADLRAHSMDFLTAEEIIWALEVKVEGIAIEHC